MNKSASSKRGALVDQTDGSLLPDTQMKNGNQSRYKDIFNLKCKYMIEFMASCSPKIRKPTIFGFTRKFEEWIAQPSWNATRLLTETIYLYKTYRHWQKYSTFITGYQYHIRNVKVVNRTNGWPLLSSHQNFGLACWKIPRHIHWNKC